MSISKILKIEDLTGTWIFIVPLTGIEITREVSSLLRIDDVVILRASSLPYYRKRLRFPVRISEFKKKHRMAGKILDESETLGVVHHRADFKSAQEAVLRQVRDELAVLALSQIGVEKRVRMGAPTIAGEDFQGKRRLIALCSKQGSSAARAGTVRKAPVLRVDKHWRNLQKKLFWSNLIAVLRGREKVSSNWRRDLRNAAILAGQSQVSLDICHAFLWNMIAIEILLTERRDKSIEVLPKRAEAFLGWCIDWDIGKFEERIRDAYHKRSEFVHAGKRDVITVDDLFFLDGLLWNLLCNLLGRPLQFRSKRDVIELSEKLEAERVLGKKSTSRPKHLRYWSRRYVDKDFEFPPV